MEKFEYRRSASNVCDDKKEHEKEKVFDRSGSKFNNNVNDSQLSVKSITDSNKNTTLTKGRSRLSNFECNTTYIHHDTLVKKMNQAARNKRMMYRDMHDNRILPNLKNNENTKNIDSNEYDELFVVKEKKITQEVSEWVQHHYFKLLTNRSLLIFVYNFFDITLYILKVDNKNNK